MGQKKISPWKKAFIDTKLQKLEKLAVNANNIDNNYINKIEGQQRNDIFEEERSILLTSETDNKLMKFIYLFNQILILPISSKWFWAVYK